MKFQSIGHKARNYLPNTFVLVDGEIFYINEDMQMYDSKGEYTGITDKKIVGMNFRTPKLGYTKLGDRWYYLKRKPIRNWKTGVYSRNTTPSAFFEGRKTSIIKALQLIEDNRYPSPERAQRAGGLMPISRCYAVSGNVLYYKDAVCGTILNNELIFEGSLPYYFHMGNLQSVWPDVNFKFEEYEYVDPYKEDV